MECYNCGVELEEKGSFNNNCSTCNNIFCCDCMSEDLDCDNFCNVCDRKHEQCTSCANMEWSGEYDD